MFKKGFFKRLLIVSIWLVIVSLLRWHWQPELINLWAGGIVGIFLLEIDHLLYVSFLYPHELTSLRFKRFIEQHRWKHALVFLMDTREERIKLVFRSALFQLVLFACCFFVLTSTDSLLGVGLVMAMALSLLINELTSLLKGKEERLRKQLFGQASEEISFNNQKLFVALMFLVFLGLNLFLI